MRTLLGIWATLLLVPIIPVVILYLIFDQANYFKLEDTAKGILATGPIAAYVALVWIGWVIYGRVSKLTVKSSSALKEVLGTWDFEAESSHGTKRSGQCTITNPRGILKISGSFFVGGNPVGQWRSQMAQLTESNLSVLYTLSEIREGKEVSSRGVCTLSFDPKSVSPMQGVWVVVGAPDAFGTITYTKV